MRLDRNTSLDGKGKYAVVRLRGIQKGSSGWELLRQLDELGHLDWGEVGNRDEFFVMKLQDKYTADGLGGYADAVMADAHKHAAGGDGEKCAELMQYAIEIEHLRSRSGAFSLFCKEPN